MFRDGLDKAVQKAFTRPIPKSAGAQMRYLVKQLKGTRAVAQTLEVSQRTVERYVKDQIKKPRKDLADRLDREVRTRWQPHIRAKAKRTAVTTGVSNDGAHLKPPMGFPYYAHMTDADLGDLIAYLRTVPAQE